MEIKKEKVTEREGLVFQTYFEKIEKEKSTYVSYIPEKQGIWVLSSDYEKDKKYAQDCVKTIIENYMENKMFSIKNILEIFKTAYYKIFEEKVKDDKNYMQDIEIASVVIKGNEAIIVNIGASNIKLYRKKREYINISGEMIKKIKIKKGDILLLSNNEFYKNLNEIIEKDEVLEKINKIQDIKYIKKQIDKKIQNKELKCENEMNFVVIAIKGKSKMKGFEVVKNKIRQIWNILSIVIILILSGIILNDKISNKSKNNKKVESYALREINNLQQKNQSLKEYEIVKNIKKFSKKIEKNEKIESEKTKFKNIEVSNNEKMKYEKEKLRKSRGRNKVKIKKYKQKKITQNRFKEKTEYKMSLEQEILKNWEILGRDKNGNVLTNKL